MPIDRGLVIIGKLPNIHSQNAKLFTKSASCKEFRWLNQKNLKFWLGFPVLPRTRFSIGS